MSMIKFYPRCWNWAIVSTISPHAVLTALIMVAVSPILAVYSYKAHSPMYPCTFTHIITAFVFVSVIGGATHGRETYMRYRYGWRGD